MTLIDCASVFIKSFAEMPFSLTCVLYLAYGALYHMSYEDEQVISCFIKFSTSDNAILAF